MEVGKLAIEINTINVFQYYITIYIPTNYVQFCYMRI